MMWGCPRMRASPSTIDHVLPRKPSPLDGQSPPNGCGQAGRSIIVGVWPVSLNVNVQSTRIKMRVNQDSEQHGTATIATTTAQLFSYHCITFPRYGPFLGATHCKISKQQAIRKQDRTGGTRLAMLQISSSFQLHHSVVDGCNLVVVWLAIWIVNGSYKLVIDAYGSWCLIVANRHWHQ